MKRNFWSLAEACLKAKFSRERLLRCIQRGYPRGRLVDGRWFVEAESLEEFIKKPPVNSAKTVRQRITNQIADEVQRDPVQTTAGIAKKLGVSQQLVSLRLKELGYEPVVVYRLAEERGIHWTEPHRFGPAKETASAIGAVDLTIAEVAERYSRSKSAVRAWLQTGALRGYRLRGREWRIPRAALVEFEEAEAAKAPKHQIDGPVDLSAWRRIK